MRPDAIIKTLEDAGFEARYVGGCVRDLLRGSETLLGRFIACVRGLRAAVNAGDINAPTLLIFHRAGAAAVGAVLQFNLINRIH